MLAVIGWPLAELFDKPIAGTLPLPHYVSDDQPQLSEMSKKFVANNILQVHWDSRLP